MEETAAAHARRILSLDPTALANVFCDVPSSTRHTKYTELRWGDFAPLTQIRKFFPDIPELAEDIARRGILNAQTVYVFPRATAQRYMDALALMWGVSQDISVLPERLLDGEPVSYILIAGERRYRALAYLWERGCTHCRGTYGAEARGVCFTRHFPEERITVNLKVGFTPYEALTDQFAENTYHRPRPDEEAVGFRVFYELMRVREPELTVSEFSRRVGHHETRVRAALRYTHLPEFIQAAVATGSIPYTSALALERYHHVRQDETELRYWLTRAIAESEMSSQRLANLLKDDIKAWRSSQMGLFGNALAVMQEKKIRRVFDRNIARALDRIIGFIMAGISAERSGRVGKDDSPFAMGSVVRNVIRIYRLLDVFVPAIQQAMARREKEEIDAIRGRIGRHIDWMEERAGHDDA